MTVGQRCNACGRPTTGIIGCLATGPLPATRLGPRPSVWVSVVRALRSLTSGVVAGRLGVVPRRCRYSDHVKLTRCDRLPDPASCLPYVLYGVVCRDVDEAEGVGGDSGADRGGGPGGVSGWYPGDAGTGRARTGLR